MIYGELYIPQFAQGLCCGSGRFISIPDIEAQLAPEQLHVLALDDLRVRQLYQRRSPGTLAVTKNWFVQARRVIGSDTAAWRWGETVRQPVSQSGFPGTHDPKDPGAQPSVTAARPLAERQRP